jgi:hypothetical protein
MMESWDKHRRNRRRRLGRREKRRRRGRGEGRGREERRVWGRRERSGGNEGSRIRRRVDCFKDCWKAHNDLRMHRGGTNLFS